MVSMRWRLVVRSVVFWGIFGIASSKCSIPPPRDPATLDPWPEAQEFEVGTELIYKCTIGYHGASGSGGSTCISDSGNFLWTTPTLSCSPITCPQPEKLFNGEVIGTEYSFGKTVSFKCNDGYLMYRPDDDQLVRQGEEPERECVSPGEWNGATPVCKPVQCPRPKDVIANGDVDFHSLNFMEIVKYSCKAGYQIKGDAQRRCLATGDWSGKDPKCIEIQCLDPSDDEFKTKYPGVSSHLELSVDPGHKAHFECAEDKSKSVASRCVDTGSMGEWEPPPPQCVTTPVSTDGGGTPVEPSHPVTSVTPATSGDESSHPPLTDDDSSSSDEGLPTWVVALLVVVPVALVLGGVVAYLWKRSQRQHHRIPTKDEKNGAVDLPVMPSSVHQV